MLGGTLTDGPLVILLQSPPFLYALAKETRAHHAVADGQRLALMDVESPVDYRALLARIYGFERAVDEAVTNVVGLGAACDGLRLRLSRLHDDLVALGIPPGGLTTIPRAPLVVRDAAEALALLFVVERHVLVAGLIRRHVTTQLPSLEPATSYLACHLDGGRRLRAFGEALDECIRRKAAVPVEIITAANRAFRLQSQWHARVTRLRARSVTPSYVPRQPRDAA